MDNRAPENKPLPNFIRIPLINSKTEFLFFALEGEGDQQRYKYQAEKSTLINKNQSSFDGAIKNLNTNLFNFARSHYPANFHKHFYEYDFIKYDHNINNVIYISATAYQFLLNGTHYCKLIEALDDNGQVMYTGSQPKKRKYSLLPPTANTAKRKSSGVTSSAPKVSSNLTPSAPPEIQPFNLAQALHAFGESQHFHPSTVLPDIPAFTIPDLVQVFGGVAPTPLPHPLGLQADSTFFTPTTPDPLNPASALFLQQGPTTSGPSAPSQNPEKQQDALEEYIVLGYIDPKTNYSYEAVLRLTENKSQYEFIGPRHEDAHISNYKFFIQNINSKLKEYYFPTEDRPFELIRVDQSYYIASGAIKNLKKNAPQLFPTVIGNPYQKLNDEGYSLYELKMKNKGMLSKHQHLRQYPKQLTFISPALSKHAKFDLYDNGKCLVYKYRQGTKQLFSQFVKDGGILNDIVKVTGEAFFSLGSDNNISINSLDMKIILSLYTQKKLGGITITVSNPLTSTPHNANISTSSSTKPSTFSSANTTTLFPNSGFPQQHVYQYNDFVVIGHDKERAGILIKVSEGNQSYYEYLGPYNQTHEQKILDVEAKYVLDNLSKTLGNLMPRIDLKKNTDPREYNFKWNPNGKYYLETDTIELLRTNYPTIFRIELKERLQPLLTNTSQREEFLKRYQNINLLELRQRPT